MDLDGIQAQLCFPQLPRFAGTLFLEGEDRSLALDCVRAYNDFVIDEWCGAAPGRFIPMVILPLWDPALAVEEIERTGKKGAKAIAFPENPVPLGLPSFHTDHWNPVFAAAQELDAPLCLHFGTSGSSPNPAPDAPGIVPMSLMGLNSMSTTADLIFSDVFHEFPNLKVVLAEGGIGWIPWLVERLDHMWGLHRHYTGVNTTVPPSELFHKHMFGCFVDDPVGITLRHQIGIDNILWECDYPHSDSFWPHARERLTEQLAEVPDNEVHAIVENNARRLFNFFE
jgi:predicted TIM-barrel fold metal-dependent hydrolase